MLSFVWLILSCIAEYGTAPRRGRRKAGGVAKGASRRARAESGTREPGHTGHTRGSLVLASLVLARPRACLNFTLVLDASALLGRKSSEQVAVAGEAARGNAADLLFDDVPARHVSNSISADLRVPRERQHRDSVV